MAALEVVRYDKSKRIVAGVFLASRRDARSIDVVPTFKSLLASSRVFVADVETEPPIGGSVFDALLFPSGAPCLMFAHFAATIAR